MRKGTIIAYNTKIGHGIIKDTNNQKIKFHLESKEQVSRLDFVQFDIALVNGSLRAVDVSKIHDFEPISLK